MPIGRIRKSGNSIVLALPPELVKERSLDIGETVEFEVFNRVNLQKLFGRGRHLKINAQKAKDMARKEWSF